MAVRLDHPPHAESLAGLKQQLVLVGGIDEERLARLFAAQHKDVVIDRPHDVAVDFEPTVLVMERHLRRLTRYRRSDRLTQWTKCGGHRHLCRGVAI